MIENLQDNILNLLAAIDDCRERKQLLPCLLLIYSGIDIVASLERKYDEGTAAAFQRWVDNYIYPETNFDCSSKDLYGARCGIVHTFSSFSDYSRSGRAKEVIYAWGNASADKLREVSKTVGRTNIVLDIDRLIFVFKSGVGNYFLEVSKNFDRSKNVMKNAGLWLMNLGKNDLEDIMKMINQAPGT